MSSSVGDFLLDQDFLGALESVLHAGVSSAETSPEVGNIIQLVWHFPSRKETGLVLHTMLVEYKLLTDGCIIILTELSLV